MINQSKFLLYLVSDSRFEESKSMYEQIEEALKNGVSILQFRGKDLSDDEFEYQAFKLRKLTEKYDVPLVINDRVHIALKCGADGVHIGRNDMGIEEARRILGKDIFIGSSVASVEEAKRAEKLGADYIGVGAMFTTKTKTDTRSVSPKLLKKICLAIDIPAVAIGGINEKNIDKLKGTGISGVAVVSAILDKSDIKEATKELRQKCEELFI